MEEKDKLTEEETTEQEAEVQSNQEIEETESEKHEENDENSELQALNEKVATLEKEKNDYYDRLLRLQAEFDNYKKRTLKEREADRKYKSQDLANELLPVIDNFERALKVEVTEETKGLYDGIMMVYRQLLDALKSQGVEVIEAEGKEFDPNIHHAVMQEEDETKDSNIVTEELQKGYMLKDRVIRPAMVKVNK